MSSQKKKILIILYQSSEEARFSGGFAHRGRRYLFMDMRQKTRAIADSISDYLN
jgi:hypothetical protein